ncbi:holliday junction-specific endonuclease [Achromobacter phage JWF]|uniref:Holliday junction resolvase n=1 Tax=Achromobacter phage JWF TaxID=1589748 RepID=UPI000588E117|nr:Holliday junction resolvase [Achromobacter phage JWF]AJD82940.1 holliday junction-specific endonuclease [Achromobacter phage JWF]
MARSKGKISEDYFESWWKPHGKRVHVQRFTDTLFVMGQQQDRLARKDAQPADYLVSAYGKMFYAEVKESENATSFSFGNITKNQMACARQTLAAGGRYYFFINHIVTNLWHVVDAEAFIRMIDNDMKSVKWHDIPSRSLQQFTLELLS